MRSTGSTCSASPKRATVAIRIMSLYRTVVVATPAQREFMLRDVPRSADMTASLSSTPPMVGSTLEPAAPPLQRLLRVNLSLSRCRPRCGRTKF